MLNGEKKLLTQPISLRLRAVKTARHKATKITLKIIFSVFFIFNSSLLVFGEEWKSPDSDTSLGHFPTKFAADLSHLFTQDNFSILCVGTMATAFDWGGFDPQNQLASRLVQLNAQPLFDFGNFYGEGWVEGGGALGSWALGALTNDLKLQQFGRDATETLIMSTVLVTGVKYAVNRTRPDGGSLSFPSGHSITAFCIAPVVQKYWGWEAGIPAYLLATVTTFARVEGYHHYLSDTIAGATLGIILGNAVVYSPKDVSVSVGLDQVDLKLTFN